MKSHLPLALAAMTLSLASLAGCAETATDEAASSELAIQETYASKAQQCEERATNLAEDASDAERLRAHGEGTRCLRKLNDAVSLTIAERSGDDAKATFDAFRAAHASLCAFHARDAAKAACAFAAERTIALVLRSHAGEDSTQMSVSSGHALLCQEQFEEGYRQADGLAAWKHLESEREGCFTNVALAALDDREAAIGVETADGIGHAHDGARGAGHTLCEVATKAAGIDSAAQRDLHLTACWADTSGALTDAVDAILGEIAPE